MLCFYRPGWKKERRETQFRDLIEVYLCSISHLILPLYAKMKMNEWILVIILIIIIDSIWPLLM